mgnify:CR=1 FL=1
MALQQINWDQINSEYVPSGTTVNLGSESTPLNAVYADNIYVNGTTVLRAINAKKKELESQIEK